MKYDSWPADGCTAAFPARPAYLKRRRTSTAHYRVVSYRFSLPVTSVCPSPARCFLAAVHRRPPREPPPSSACNYLQPPLHLRLRRSPSSSKLFRLARSRLVKLGPMSRVRVPHTPRSPSLLRLDAHTCDWLCFGRRASLQQPGSSNVDVISSTRIAFLDRAVSRRPPTFCRR